MGVCPDKSGPDALGDKFSFDIGEGAERGDWKKMG